MKPSATRRMMRLSRRCFIKKHVIQLFLQELGIDVESIENVELVTESPSLEGVSKVITFDVSAKLASGEYVMIKMQRASHGRMGA